MDVLESGTCERTWAIVDTLYFDSRRHRFVRGDIEIEGGRIAAVMPPHTSQRACLMPGDSTVCLPGLIEADATPAHQDWSGYSLQLASYGVTTAGIFFRNPADCAASDEAHGPRRLFYVELTEDGGSANGAEAGARMLEGIVRLSHSFRRQYCTFMPAVVPGEVGSAATLVAAARVAERLGSRLCVRLSSTATDAMLYKETRYFTEVGLLSYLSLLSQATIFNLSQLSRCDVAMVNESAATLVCAPGAVSEWLLEERFARLSLKDRALAFSIDRHTTVRGSRYRSLTALSSALTHQPEKAATLDDFMVDALTCSAAQALGIADIGQIAADMKADLCLFDRPDGLEENAGSRDFIELITYSEPRDVLIGGLPLTRGRIVTRELEESYAGMHPRGVMDTAGYEYIQYNGRTPGSRQTRKFTASGVRS